MENSVKYGLIIAAVAAVYFISQSNGPDDVALEDDIDMNMVLDVTVDTMDVFQQDFEMEGSAEKSLVNDDQLFTDFAETLSINYNNAVPSLYDSEIGVIPQADASLLAYSDDNFNSVLDDGEALLFKIEVDGENARILASGRSGEVSEHHFSGTSLLAGYFIGSMLSRQSRAGVNTNALASKKPVSARSAASARARAGSGSHSRGK